MTTLKAAPGPTKLTFDRRQTLRFIAALENTYSADWNFRCIPKSKACREKVSRFFKLGRQLPRMKFRGSFAQHEAMLRKRNTQGFAIYYSLNLMDKDGVKARNCFAVRAIALDLDSSPLPARWANHVKPHIIIETSPGRYQCLFRVFVCEDFDAAEGVGRRLAAFYGGDASVADRARALRLPGFVHQKGKPFTSRLIHVDDAPFPPDGSFDDYGLEAFAFLPKLPKRKPSSSNGLGTLNTKAAKLLFEHYPVELLSGNEAWQNFAMALHSACGGNAEVAELFFEFCMTDDNYGVEDDDRNRMRWDSFTAEKEGGLTIATLRKLCYEAQVPAPVRFTIFNNAARDFDND